MWGIILPSILIYCSRGCKPRFLSYDQKTLVLFFKCKLWCYKQFWKKNLQAKLKKKLRNFLVKVVTISSLCIMHFDIGHVLWGWAAQPTPNLAPASPQTNNNNMSSCLTQLLRPKIISTLKWDDTLIKMPSIFQEKTRRTIWFPSNLKPNWLYNSE